MKFNSEEYIEQVILRNSLKSKREELLKKNDEKYIIETRISDKKTLINEKKEAIKGLKNFKNVFFHARDTFASVRVLEQEIEILENEIIECQQNLTVIEDTIKAIEEEISKQESMIKMSLPAALRVEDDCLTITDEPVFESDGIYTADEVMVHCTDFFPKNKTILSCYDGDKKAETLVSYKGVTKKIRALAHRHTCHFTINNIVESTGDGKGTWKQMPYVIIEPLEIHREQFKSISPSDSWTYGSVQLGENPILLVREDMYSQIPPEELSKFTVIKYRGNCTKCVENLFKILKIKTYETDANSAAHNYSLEKALESSLIHRDLAINYIKNNSWDGKSPITLTEEELFEVYSILDKDCLNGIYAQIDWGLYSNEVKKYTQIDSDFIIFMIGCGILKINSYTYTVKPDYMVYSKFYELTQKLRASDLKAQLFVEFCNLNGDIKVIFERYKNYVAKDNQISYDVYSMSCDELFKFENFQAAKIILEDLKQICCEIPCDIGLTEKGCDFVFTLSPNEYDYSSIESLGMNLKLNGDMYKCTQSVEAKTGKELLAKAQCLIELLKSTKKANVEKIETSKQI